MLVFNEKLVTKSLNILTYIKEHGKRLDLSFVADLIECDEYSFSYMFTLDNSKVIEIKISDQFSHSTIEYKVDDNLVEIAEFGALYTLETEIDIDFLNESFLEDLEEKTLLIENVLINPRKKLTVKTIKNTNRQIARLTVMKDEMELKHRGKEQTDYTYHGGFSLGYLTGQITEMENFVDDLKLIFKAQEVEESQE
jgi:hypothetical protein